MRAVCLTAGFLRLVLLLAVEVALLPLRFAAGLFGGALILSGVIGVPAWLIQIAVSILGGPSAGGPLPAWAMCLLLAAAIPAGLLLLHLAHTPLRPAAVRDTAPAEHTSAPSTAAEPEQVPAMPSAASRIKTVHAVRVKAAYREVLQHELRARIAAPRVSTRPQRHRGHH